MYGHAAAAGSGTKGTTASPHSAEPATTVAVSSSASPPGADLSSAFQLACSSPAPSTASVTPSVSSIYAVRGLRFFQPLPAGGLGAAGPAAPASGSFRR